MGVPAISHLGGGLTLQKIPLSESQTGVASTHLREQCSPLSPHRHRSQDVLNQLLLASTDG